MIAQFCFQGQTLDFYHLWDPTQHRPYNPLTSLLFCTDISFKNENIPLNLHDSSCKIDQLQESFFPPQNTHISLFSSRTNLWVPPQSPAVYNCKINLQYIVFTVHKYFKKNRTFNTLLFFPPFFSFSGYSSNIQHIIYSSEFTISKILHQRRIIFQLP